MSSSHTRNLIEGKLFEMGCLTECDRERIVLAGMVNSIRNERLSLKRMVEGLDGEARQLYNVASAHAYDFKAGMNDFIDAMNVELLD